MLRKMFPISPIPYSRLECHENLASPDSAQLRCPTWIHSPQLTYFAVFGTIKSGSFVWRESWLQVTFLGSFYGVSEACVMIALQFLFDELMLAGYLRDSTTFGRATRPAIDLLITWNLPFIPVLRNFTVASLWIEVLILFGEWENSFERG